MRAAIERLRRKYRRGDTSVQASETARGSAIISDPPDSFALDAAPLPPNATRCRYLSTRRRACSSSSPPADDCVQLRRAARGAQRRHARPRRQATCSSATSRAVRVPRGRRDAVAARMPTAISALPNVDPACYALGLEVARGGMGRIIAARDLRLGRPVAIKELLGRSPQLAARFQREARITARLQHPGIVPIYESGQVARRHAVLRDELVVGPPLDEVIDGARDAARAARAAAARRSPRPRRSRIAHAQRVDPSRSQAGATCSSASTARPS